MDVKEACIIIDGQQLSFAQSMAVRVAVASMLFDLYDPVQMTQLGKIGPLYQQRLREVQSLIIESCSRKPY